MDGRTDELFEEVTLRTKTLMVKTMNEPYENSSYGFSGSTT